MSNFIAYSYDDYSVHVRPSVTKRFLHRGYVTNCIGCGITGDIQTNDTYMHHPVKVLYRHLEAELLFAQGKSRQNSRSKQGRYDPHVSPSREGSKCG